MFRILLCIALISLQWSKPSGLQPPRLSRANGNWGTCSVHPGKISGVVPISVRPVLLKRWYFKQRSSRYLFEPSVYIPRLQDPYFFPAGYPSNTKYKGFDFFNARWSGQAGPLETDTLRMELHRPATVYLVMPAFSVPKGAHLPGYKAVAFARISKPRSRLSFGYYKDQSVPLRDSVVLFSKSVGESFQLPSPAWVRKQLKGIFVPDTRYQILLSEADGSASTEPKTNNGLFITPGHKCPEVLHNTWVTTNDDPNDSAISNMKFPTWHPIWDPCYWCTYGHEHGSNAPALTGIKPKLSYPSLKNGNENEQHEGHKIFVFEIGRYYFIHIVHVDLATGHRFFVRRHSGGFIITDKNTGELLAYVLQKVDFGTMKARVGGYTDLNGADVNSRVIFLWPKQAAIVDMNKQGLSDRSILLNVINGNIRSQLDPRYTYRVRNLFTEGSYEQWRAAMQCTNTNNTKHLFEVDIRDPSTAMKSADSKRSDAVTQLFKATKPYGTDNFVQMASRQVSIDRRLLLRCVTVAHNLCPHGGRDDRGIWYTDPKGYISYNAPGPARIRQYMKPGFSLVIAGDITLRYEVSDTWTGLYKQGFGKGSFSNVGNGIDYLVN